MNESDQELADLVLPDAVEEIAVPLELTQLAPWHRSRKQFIRKNQWGMLSSRVIEKSKGTPALPQQVGGTHEVKYLTLPGSDLLDVEMLGSIARDLGCTLTSVGFLAGAVGNATTARAELRREGLIEAGVISERSYTFSRRIEEITAKSSAAYRDMRTRGPYHVINLDACGSIAPPNAPNNNRLIQVVSTLVEYQFDSFRGRWLLLLTSDVRAEQFDEAVMQQLMLAVRLNCQQLPDFADGVKVFLDDEGDDLNAALQTYISGGIDNFMKLFSLGFGKWLLGLAKAAGWDMKMHNAFCYSTTPEGDDRATMPCMAFEFRPPTGGLVDPVGIAIAPPPVLPQYGARALTVLEKVYAMENLDARMAANEGERAELIQDTRERLSSIGYGAEVLQNLA